MTSHQRLYKDMIRDTKLWNLYLAPGTDSVDVMAYCPLEDHSLFVSTVPLDNNSSSRVTAIEEAIYDNPLLLNEFNRVTVISRCEERAILPAKVTADTDLVSDIVEEMTGISGRQLIVDDLPLLDTAICHLIDRDIYNFLCRTFNGVKFIHRLSALTRYFHGTHRGAGSLTSHVNLRRGSLDIVLYHSDKLLLANTYQWVEPADALYFIAATRSAFDIDRRSPVVLSGDRDVREELTPLLRQYLPTVMPAVFPAAMFRAGGQTAMNAPTDLIVMPLCE